MSSLTPPAQPAAKRQKVDPKQVAYLGPPGTYGHQAATALSSKLRCSVELVPCPTIPDIYKSPAPFLVMPLQNTIHGGVLETLDCLLSTFSPHSDPASVAGPSGTSKANGHAHLVVREPKVMGLMDLPIRHCLVARKGLKIGDIKWVRSHEQALGQSAVFLSTHLPHAKRIRWPSTAGAALSLLDPDVEPNSAEEGSGAAICSKAVIGLHPDELEVLYEGTQALEDNYTRFLLLTRLPLSDLEWDTAPPPIPLPLPSFYVLSAPSALNSFHPRYHIIQIHSRPAPLSRGSKTEQGDNFPSRLLVEVEPLDPSDEPAFEHGPEIVSLGRARFLLNSS